MKLFYKNNFRVCCIQRKEPENPTSESLQAFNSNWKGVLFHS
jgi:hypothetical protein